MLVVYRCSFWLTRNTFALGRWFLTLFECWIWRFWKFTVFSDRVVQNLALIFKFYFQLFKLKTFLASIFNSHFFKTYHFHRFSIQKTPSFPISKLSSQTPPHPKNKQTLPFCQLFSFSLCAKFWRAFLIFESVRIFIWDSFFVCSRFGSYFNFWSQSWHRLTCFFKFHPQAFLPLCFVLARIWSENEWWWDQRFAVRRRLCQDKSIQMQR